MDDMDDDNKENGMYLQAAIIFHKKINDTFSENLGKVTVLALISIIYSNWHFNCSKCIWSVKTFINKLKKHYVPKIVLIFLGSCVSNFLQILDLQRFWDKMPKF